MESSVGLSDLVTWNVTPVPLWRRAARYVPTVAGTLVAVALSSPDTVDGPSTFDPHVHPDRDDDLGDVSVKGTGAGMPRAYPSAQMVSIYRDRATITPGLHPVELPLTSMRIAKARATKLRLTHRKAADAIWTIKVTGRDTALTFKGRWLLLAQLGALGRWPEPP